MTILTDQDIEQYVFQLGVEEDRREVLRIVVRDANHVAAEKAHWTTNDGQPSTFLRAAAHCLVLGYLCRPDKELQQQFFTSFWNLIRLDRQWRERSCTTLH